MITHIDAASRFGKLVDSGILATLESAASALHLPALEWAIDPLASELALIGRCIGNDCIDDCPCHRWARTLHFAPFELGANDTEQQWYLQTAGLLLILKHER